MKATGSSHLLDPAANCLLLGLVALGPLPARAAGEVEWHAGRGFRWAELVVPREGRTGFTPVQGETAGITFSNVLDELEGAANRVLYNGSGVAAGDYDGDGLPDIFFCSLSGKNALFRNLGSWRFQDVTAAAGLNAPLPQTRGAVFADLDGDGDLDLLVTVTGKGVICFTNDGHGRFTEASAAIGASGKYGSTTMALADVDGNGTLDLYVANYRPDDIRDRGRVAMSLVNGRPVLQGTETNRFILLNGRLQECGQPDLLLVNDGNGRFKPVSWTGGAFLDEEGRRLAEPPLDWGLTATFRDVNGDMAPDLYVCNDYWTPDRFWINDGRGRFRAIEKLALRKTSASSMSADFADIDRDGNLDLFVVDMLSRDPPMRKRQMLAQMPQAAPVGVADDRPQVVRNTLFLNRGDGTYAEIAFYAGLFASDWSWSPVFWDVDLDGYEDLVIGAGHFRDVQDYDAEAQVQARQHSWAGFKNDAERQRTFTRELMEHYHLYPLLQMPVIAFRNSGTCAFEETTEAWGLNHPGVHQGLAMADLDQDGDLDLVVNNLNASAMLFRNDIATGRVAVRLKGKPPNTKGVGAKVSLLDGAVPRQTTEVICGGRYQSGSDMDVVFATGAARSSMTIEVRWRAGGATVINEVERDRLYEIDESASESRPATPRGDAAPLFEDVSTLVPHRHHETEFDDYERQPLLPFKLSQLGPGVAWYDIDGDGHDDVVIGSGRGGVPAVFKADGHGKFSPCRADKSLVVSNDTAGVAGWSDGTASRQLLAALSGYEAKSEHAAVTLRLTGDLLAAGMQVASEMSSGGALALGDLNGDGKLALFVAGGVSPGRYPLGAPSRLYRFDGRKWAVDSRNSVLFENLGIINGAVWSDLDGDGLPELVLACEWGPIRVFRNRGGALFEVTDELGLKPYTGWWRGVTTGDLNNDGRLDIIASNWGLNSSYRASAPKPLTFMFGQIAQPDVMEIIETEYVGTTLVTRRQFKDLANSMPFLFDRFNSHKAFSEATANDVLGERLPLARRVTATTLASTVFMNLGNKFNAVELPNEAQFAPAFGVSVADFDGDGNEDVFLSQNFSQSHPETGRLDAGLGLLLRGDGTGKLAAVPSARSGIRMPGDQRGAAVGDYDEDGRVDLVVAQNGAATKLYRNIGGQPGLRIRLKGLPGNPDGIGAAIRLRFKERVGAAREIHAGSGYWSQDSATQVMATPGKPDAILVRWPGGRLTTTMLPPDAREIAVGADGSLTTVR